MAASIFTEIGIIIVIATVIAALARLFRQPLIPSYILTGIILGPFGLRLVTDIELIKTLSEIGIAFLLFVVGLEIDFKRLKNVGHIATLGALTRSVILFTIGFIAAALMGFLTLDATYLALMIAFSSTTVVIKVLSDKKEL